MPSTDHTLAQLGEAVIFSKLDANSGFWQIPLSEKSSRLTTFITPFGRYRFLRLPFGITSAPEIFQKRIWQVLEGLPGQACHLDDILIFGRTQEEHDRNLEAGLSRLRGAGVTLNKEKCVLSKRSVKFLGHIIMSDGIKADPVKVTAIQEMAEPKMSQTSANSWVW